MAKGKAALMLGLAGAIALMAQIAAAEGLGRSAHPPARPAAAVIAPVLAVSAAQAVPMPRPRPAGLASVAPAPAAVPDIPAATPAPQIAAEIAPLPRPRARPGNLDTRARLAPEETGVTRVVAPRILPGKQAVLPQKGSVCGDPAIRGERLAPITSRVQGCGIAEPVRVTAIAGVKFSTPATISCETATAARQWIERGIQPAFGNQVVGLHIGGSYVCRPRNGKAGAKVSEHGRGRALDVMGFTLANGQKLSVLRDYRKSKAIKSAHRAACGPFGTTLGPGSDGYHEDHLHVDVVSYRNGTYCR